MNPYDTQIAKILLKIKKVNMKAMNNMIGWKKGKLNSNQNIVNNIIRKKKNIIQVKWWKQMNWINQIII